MHNSVAGISYTVSLYAMKHISETGTKAEVLPYWWNYHSQHRDRLPLKFNFIPVYVCVGSVHSCQRAFVEAR